MWLSAVRKMNDIITKKSICRSDVLEDVVRTTWIISIFSPGTTGKLVIKIQ